MGLGSSRKPAPRISPRVMVIDFHPAAVPPEWNRAGDLVRKYIPALQQASAGALNYQVVKTVELTAFPPLLGERQYDDESWSRALPDDAAALRNPDGSYPMADYIRIVRDLGVLPLVNGKQVDEVWMFGGPYFGFYESRMLGRKAFWCNAPPIEIESRRFVMMGFNYQRDVREMVHDFGHRAESILSKKFDSQIFLEGLYAQGAAGAGLGSAPKNEFEVYLTKNGTVHRKPGGQEYDQDELAWVTGLKPAWFLPAVDPNRVRLG